MPGGMSGCENKVLLQTCGSSESGDHIKGNETSKLSEDKHVQEAQDLRRVPVKIRKAYRKI